MDGVEAAQLAAIARQFGIDWRPASGSDRAVLERPGRLLGREEIMAPLRLALAGVGVPDTAEVEMPGFIAPLIPSEARPEIAIEQLDYVAGGPDGGRFAASVAIRGQGIGIQRLRIAGTVAEMIVLPVLTHRLLPGAIIVASDLQSMRLRAATVRGEIVTTAAQAVGRAARRTLMPGQPMALGDLGAPELVTKGARVSMQLLNGGLTLLANGQAMEAGALGDRVSVLNPTSRAVIEAEVIGPGRVRVLPESTPLVAPGGTRFSSLPNGATTR